MREEKMIRERGNVKCLGLEYCSLVWCGVQ